MKILKFIVLFSICISGWVCNFMRINVYDYAMVRQVSDTVKTIVIDLQGNIISGGTRHIDEPENQQLENK